MHSNQINKPMINDEIFNLENQYEEIISETLQKNTIAEKVIDKSIILHMIREQIFNLTHVQKLFNILKAFNQEYTMEQENDEQSITNSIRNINKLYFTNENIHTWKM
jgi:hypothetical protein